MNQAWLALGSNQGDSFRHLREAVAALERLPHTRVRACSPMYRTPPWGVAEQPPFINAALELETELAPHRLLEAMLAIEREHGRRRDGERWGPRTLDLDLLHVDGVQVDDAQLTLPHPRIRDRAFVLLPLNDLAPDLVLPGQGQVAQLLAAIDTAGCERLPETLR